MTVQFKTTTQASEKGSAIVEAAVVLLLFFTIVFGVFEASRFLNTQQVLTNAAREGARLAVAPLSGTNTLATEAEITARVEQFLDSARITGAEVFVTNPVMVATGPVQTAYTRVLVQADYAVLTIPGIFDALEVTLKGEALMRNETSD